MPNLLKCRIITPDDGILFEQDIISCELKTIYGCLTIQANQPPLIGTIVKSRIYLKFSNNEKKDAIIVGGLFNLNDNNLVINASFFEWIIDFDINKINNEIKKLQSELTNDPNNSNIKTRINLLNQKIIAYNNK